MSNNPIVYLILKRLRAPLILLILSWTVAVVGLALIPGVEIDGARRYLTIFEAFYFVSYMATTIGFGETHFGFTDPQRLWVTFSIYLTVISWLVAIGKIISLLQDPALKKAWARQKFIKQVKAIPANFYIICGYGETGELLLEYLTSMGHQCVVIDSDIDRINLLDLNSSIYNTPFLYGDASDVETLRMGGLESPQCKAVLAVTNNDRVNVKVSVAAKLIRSNVKVICRVHSKEAMANAKSFDTDYVIDPNHIFAGSIGKAFRMPTIQQLAMTLLRRPGREHIEPLKLPKGLWIICGYSDFGQEMAKYLDFEGMDYKIISDMENLNVPYVRGKGTGSVSLREAGIEKAVAVVAGTSDDTDNLSILMTARALKPNLFLVAKQNQDSNRLVFKNAEIDIVMESARLMVWQAIPLITQPMMASFLRLVRHQDEAWGKEVMEQLRKVSEKVPYTYLIKINDIKSPAVVDYLDSGNILRLQELFVNEISHPDQLIAIPLMLMRDGKEELLPKASIAIKKGDVFLMASEESARDQVRYTISHEQDFHYVIHGEEKPVSIVMELIKQKIKDYKVRKRNKRKAESARVNSPADKAHHECNEN